MTLDGWMTVAVVAGTLALMGAARVGPELALVGAVTALLALGVLTPAEALSGLANPGIATLGVLYVVVSGVVQTGAIHWLGHRLLGRPRGHRRALVRLMAPVMAVSALLNNTPVVAMMVPVVEEWCRRHRLSVSKFMIPLSYAAILGGTCTAIGTSTNIVILGLVAETPQLAPFGFFEIGALGLPFALLGLVYVLALSPRLLPDRRPPLATLEDAREYAMELMVEAASPLVGKTIEEAGLRHLPGAFLAEITRRDRVMPAVPPTERLEAGDRLLFVGAVESVVDLVKIRGLAPAPDQLYELDAPRPERRIVEAVVSDASPLVGTTIRDGRFRSRYDAVVIAVARNGERLRGKIGDIALRAGDVLLVEARPGFVERFRASRDFWLVSEVHGAHVPRHERAGTAWIVLVCMVVAASLFGVPILTAALVAALAMIGLRCTTIEVARQRIDGSVLLINAAALGVAAALDKVGVACLAGESLVSLAAGRPWLALTMVYLATNLLTELITNSGAAILTYPLALHTAARLGVDPRPFVALVMVAASASFATPIGYQTNLMVYGPGGYRFSDFLRFGLPMNILLGAVAIALAPLVWPF